MLHLLNFTRQHRDKLRFAQVGVASTSIDFILFWLLLELSLAATLAHTLSFACGTLFGAIANRNYTFGDRHRPPYLEAIWRTFAIYGATLCTTACLLTPLQQLLPPLAAKMALIPLSVLLNYLGLRYLVFRVTGY